jgi:hypothetical protein
MVERQSRRLTSSGPPSGLGRAPGCCCTAGATFLITDLVYVKHRTGPTKAVTYVA